MTNRSVTMNPKAPEPDENGVRQPQVCPECGSDHVETRLEPHQFKYGLGRSAVSLSATVPVRSCGVCGFTFLDSAAEKAQHDAVCQHLGVLSPSAIRGIRMNAGLSRDEFAEITRLGRATISRWERGILIQNAAYDRYLRLLAFPENLERLKRSFDREVGLDNRPAGSQPCPRFRALSRVEPLRREQESFTLRRAG